MQTRQQETEREIESRRHLRQFRCSQNTRAKESHHFPALCVTGPKLVGGFRQAGCWQCCHPLRLDCLARRDCLLTLRSEDKSKGQLEDRPCVGDTAGLQTSRADNRAQLCKQGWSLQGAKLSFQKTSRAKNKRGVLGEGQHCIEWPNFCRRIGCSGGRGPVGGGRVEVGPLDVLDHHGSTGLRRVEVHRLHVGHHGSTDLRRVEVHRLDERNLDAPGGASELISEVLASRDSSLRGTFRAISEVSIFGQVKSISLAQSPLSPKAQRTQPSTEIQSLINCSHPQGPSPSLARRASAPKLQRWRRSAAQPEAVLNPARSSRSSRSCTPHEREERRAKEVQAQKNQRSCKPPLL